MSLSDWFDLVSLLRSYCLRKYGCVPTRITLDLPIGRAVEPIPPCPFLDPGGGPDVLPICRPEPPDDPEGDAVAPDPPGVRAGAPRHSPDFRLVSWPGLGSFVFSPKQALAVRELWAAEEGGNPEVPERQLLAAADSDGDRLADLFKRSPAWGVLVLRGARPGTFRLPEPPGEAEA